ncbi:MAG: transcription antitermination factor NusB [Verrucomicrobiae bacterium]|nr:transcription antitermination factor NusB [Verrucomicrobiae bacterium]
MGFRRDAREKAMQFLYQAEVNPGELEEQLAIFWAMQENEVARNTRTFADELIRGAARFVDESDERIKKYSQNWDFHRIAHVDRNIMRLAIYELLHREDIPPVVTINEAVDIAKRFSTDDSGKFVNGILDRVKEELTRPFRTAAGGQDRKK